MPKNLLCNFTDEELNAYVKALARNKYRHYVEYVHNGQYKHGKHTLAICDALQKVEEGKIKRLAIFLPPRHSKSMTVTETFPSYVIGRNPNRRVIEASYSAELSKKFGRANKQKVQNYGKDLFGIELPNDNRSTTNWGIEGHRGGMLSVGVGGAITGQGADFLIIDDPIKNAQEADSKTYRERLWHEWESTLFTRLQPNGAVILILTRWHEDDLAGRILAQQGEEWTVINIPCICEDEATDYLGRKLGETIWSEIGFDQKWAEDTKRSVGTRTWNALYQQRPAPAEGSLLKRNWWKYYRTLPARFEEVIQSWDCTFKDADTSDFVVGQVWGKIGADKYLIDQVRGRMDIVATMQAIRNLSAKYPQARRKLVEDKANGTAVIALLKREIVGLIPVNPQGGKVVRATAVSPDVEAGNVFLPDPTIAPWVNDFVEECASFPNSVNDDMVDCFSQALSHWIGKRVMGTLQKPSGW